MRRDFKEALLKSPIVFKRCIGLVFQLKKLITIKAIIAIPEIKAIFLKAIFLFCIINIKYKMPAIIIPLYNAN